jgi:hypothetical protein
MIVDAQLIEERTNSEWRKKKSMSFHYMFYIKLYRWILYYYTDANM